ncbi:unnamed protein product [Paramecium pentaurelia]|uniref:Uncharacterized protein n=1 Tax=Paramecium pentaurelia TaxID=43138 RepID=A0A8S1WV89_9CILI|nr:unnamed protein product [Paramecium pentaurelia]CAD8193710.1 unnamed protein product [Paramecium pentaurelia]
MQTILTKLFQELKLFIYNKNQGDVYSVFVCNIKIIKLGQLKEIISSLNQLVDTINPQAIEKSEQNLHQYMQVQFKIMGLIQIKNFVLFQIRNIIKLRIQKKRNFRNLKNLANYINKFQNDILIQINGQIQNYRQ